MAVAILRPYQSPLKEETNVKIYENTQILNLKFFVTK